MSFVAGYGAEPQLKLKIGAMSTAKSELRVTSFWSNLENILFRYHAAYTEFAKGRVGPSPSRSSPSPPFPTLLPP